MKRKPANSESLNAVNLKEQLWDTLKKVKSSKIKPGQGDSIAAQAREILRTIKSQVMILGQSGKSLSNELVEFAKPTR